MNSEQIREQVTSDIMSALEAGIRPWQRPWKATGGGHHNCITGHVYQGMNVWWLTAQAWQRGYDRDQWLTYRQAQANGGHVMKGEKGCHILKPQPFVRKDANGNPVLDSQGNEVRGITFATISVFNVAQTESVELPERETLVLEPIEPDVVAEMARALAARNGARVDHGGDMAFYQPATDRIQMPPFEAFETSAGYAATLFHELTHWTGHKSRLDRLGETNRRGYAFEELVAELGASMLCGAHTITNDIEHHASYIGSWLKALAGDSTYLFKAASLSQKAVELLVPELARNEQQEQREAA